MIGTLYIKCNAQHNNIALPKLFAFTSSPSSLRIIDVPKKIGNWKIDSVVVSLNYPDNTIKSVNCRLVAGAWIGTLGGCDVAGKSVNGYGVFASGTDENGDVVENYCLGRGDVEILDADSTIDLNGQTVYLHLVDEMPEVPHKGDFVNDEGTWMIYDGEEWIVFGGGSGTTDYRYLTNKPQINGTTLTGDIAAADLGINTSDLTNDSGFITSSALSDYATQEYVDDEIEVVEDKIPENTSDLNNDSGFVSYSELSYYATKDYVDGEIEAVEDDIPTKTSDLTNDSDFITSSDIPTVPTKTSDLTNDSGFITSSALSGYATETYVDGKIDEVEDEIPTNTSDLTNDSGFITSSDIPTIPTKTSDLTNDSGFISSLPIASSSVLGAIKVGQNLSITSDGTLNAVGGGGTTDYTLLTNKPQINSVTLTGNISFSDLGGNTSDLTNDSGFITSSDLTSYATVEYVDDELADLKTEIEAEIPTKTSDLTNDSDFVTEDNIITWDFLSHRAGKLEWGIGAACQYGSGGGQIAIGNSAIVTANAPTAIQLGYGTNSSNGTFQVFSYQLLNNKGKIPAERLTTALSGYATETYVDDAIDALDIPTKTSDLTNDSGFITSSALTPYAEITYVDDEIGTAMDAIANVESEIPTATSDLTNDSGFLTSSDLTSYATQTYVQDQMGTITAKIPSEATSTNKLADKAFVNSSIATNTANFKGTYNSTSELPTTGVTPNDYAFVIGSDSAGNTTYNRYKYSGSQWVFEYTLNNSSFTAQQWSSINSGVSSSDVQDIQTIKGRYADKDDVYDKSELDTFTFSGVYKDSTDTFSFDVLYVK